MSRPFRFVLAAMLALLVTSDGRAQSAGETAYVRALMTAMNQLSVRLDREVCGFVLRDADGGYSSTKASWGGPAGCATLPLAPEAIVVSSWHTHAAWAEGYDGEVPSLGDVEGATGNLRQVCGRGCLPVDPGFVPEEHGPVPEALSLEGLYARFGRGR
jgi:hypothetical protein